jgi:hypothetical protein
MKKIYLLYAFFYCSIVSIKAQQRPISSFYSYNWQVLNPAAMDNEFAIRPNSESRSILSNSNGMSGNMNSATLRMNHIGGETQATLFSAFERFVNIKNQNFRMGFALGMNKIFDTQNYLIKGNVAYLLPISTRHYLNIGFNFGAGYDVYNVSNFRYRHTDEFEIQTFSRITPNASAGIFYTLNKFHLGFSAPEIIKKSALYSTITANYEGNLIEPSILVRYVPKLSPFAFNTTLPISANLNIRYHIRELVGKSHRPAGHEEWYLGAGYSTSSILNLEFGRFISNNKYRNGAWRFGFNAGIPIAAKNNFGRFFELNVLRLW